ncbi:MAG: hypothetical protein K9G70_08930 [Prolixibacteraceae bacterium]|nr:hypothetical protein [Prolixibacteraceae bacterium]
MSGHIHKIGLISLFIVAFVINVFSINRHFTTYKMSSGLAHNTVWCLMQDNDGYVWIGTRDGLSRFDGKNFKTFKHVFGDSTSIINNHVSCLMQADNNDIWVGTVGGLSKYNKQTKEFKSYSLAVDSLSISTNYVRSILEINNQELLIGTTDGMYIFNRVAESYKFLLIDAEISSKANGIRIIFRENSGDILVGTNDGLFLFENNEFNRISLILLYDSNNISSIS